MKNKSRFGIFAIAILAIALLAVMPAAACPPQCPPGEAWQCHDEQVCGWGGWDWGKCPGGHDTQTCDQEWWWHRHYTCHNEQVCGCVDVCEGVQCGENQHCDGGSCVCDEGYHPSVRLFTTDSLFTVSDGLVCVPDEFCGDGQCNNGETFSSCPQDCPSGDIPYSNSYWYGVRDACLTPDQSEAIELPKEAANTNLRVLVFYNGDVDGVWVQFRDNDDGTCSPDGLYRVYMGECGAAGGYAGYPVVVNIDRVATDYLRVVAIKDETSTPEAFQMKIQIVNGLDNNPLTNVLWEGSTEGDQMVFDQVFNIPCRCDCKPGLMLSPLDMTLDKIVPSNSDRIDICPGTAVLSTGGFHNDIAYNNARALSKRFCGSTGVVGDEGEFDEDLGAWIFSYTPKSKYVYALTGSFEYEDGGCVCVADELNGKAQIVCK